MRIQLEKVKPWADLLLTVVSLIAIPATGWWAYHNFSVEDTHEANPNISVTAEVMPYDDERRLLVVHIRPRNLGKVPIELLGGTRGDISVDIKALPSKSPNGYLDLEGVPVTFAAHNIVSGFNGGYVMEPGIDYDEIKTFVVPRGVTYVIRAEMDHYDDSPDDEVDASYIIAAI